METRVLESPVSQIMVVGTRLELDGSLLYGRDLCRVRIVIGHIIFSSLKLDAGLLPFFFQHFLYVHSVY